MDGSVIFARLCQCAPPVTHASMGPQTKRHLDQFSCFCTVHSRVSLGMIRHVLSSKSCPFTSGDLDPHLTHDSSGASQPTTRTASWSVQPFLHSSPHSVPILYNGPPLPPSKLPLHMGYLDPHLIHGSLTHLSSQPKQHPDESLPLLLTLALASNMASQFMAAICLLSKRCECLIYIIRQQKDSFP